MVSDSSDDDNKKKVRAPPGTETSSDSESDAESETGHLTPLQLLWHLNRKEQNAPTAQQLEMFEDKKVREKMAKALLAKRMASADASPATTTGKNSSTTTGKKSRGDLQRERRQRKSQARAALVQQQLRESNFYTEIFGGTTTNTGSDASGVVGER